MNQKLKILNKAMVGTLIIGAVVILLLILYFQGHNMLIPIIAQVLILISIIVLTLFVIVSIKVKIIKINSKNKDSINL